MAYPACSSHSYPPMRRLPLLLAALLAVAGCASSRAVAPLDADLPEAFPNHSLTQIGAALASAGDTLSSFRARASLAVNAPDQSGSFSSDVRARRGDSLYLTISPGLGIEAVRALVTPDSVFVYDRLKNRVTYGAVAEAGDLLAFPLESDALFRNLLGLVVPDRAVAWNVEADSAHYVLRSPDGAEMYVVDPSIWRVVRYEQRDAAGALLEERTFSDFDRIDGTVVARRVVFRRPPRETTAALFYRDLDLNPDALAFPFRVSDSAERRAVGR